jgi:hypothetical protein
MRRTAMNPKRVLTLGLALALVFWGLGIGTALAAKTKAVNVTIRSTATLPLGPFDVVHGDGSPHPATMDTNGPALKYFYDTGEVSYDLGVDNVYFGDVACPPGTFTGTVTGSGNLKVTLATGTWLGMLIGESRDGTMQFGLEGYLLRFMPADGLVDAPNCSTHVTITRTSTSEWTVESDGDSIARLIQGGGNNWPRGRVVWTSLGHYKPAVFMMTVTSP